MYPLDGAPGINSEQTKNCNVDWLKEKKKRSSGKFGKKVTLTKGQLQANLQDERVKK
jgi:hypothetical protein